MTQDDGFTALRFEPGVPATGQSSREVARMQDLARDSLQRRVPGGRPGETLYALLDAARDEAIFPRLFEHQDELWVRSLYQGESASKLASVAPYLLRLDPGSWAERWVLREGWGRAWGILLWSSADGPTLRRHFRKLTMATTEDGERWLFRFYDPRVLRVFLPTCDDDQLSEFFGPVGSYCMEAAESGRCLEFGRGPEGLLDRTHPAAFAEIGR